MKKQNYYIEKTMKHYDAIRNNNTCQVGITETLDAAERLISQSMQWCKGAKREDYNIYEIVKEEHDIGAHRLAITINRDGTLVDIITQHRCNYEPRAPRRHYFC